MSFLNKKYATWKAVYYDLVIPIMILLIYDSIYDFFFYTILTALMLQNLETFQI